MSAWIMIWDTHNLPVAWLSRRSDLSGFGHPAVVRSWGQPASENPWRVASPPPASRCPAGSSAGRARHPPGLLSPLQNLPQSVWRRAVWCSGTGAHSCSLFSRQPRRLHPCHQWPSHTYMNVEKKGGNWAMGMEHRSVASKSKGYKGEKQKHSSGCFWFVKYRKMVSLERSSGEKDLWKVITSLILVFPINVIFFFLSPLLPINPVMYLLQSKPPLSDVLPVFPDPPIPPLKVEGFQCFQKSIKNSLQRQTAALLAFSFSLKGQLIFCCMPAIYSAHGKHFADIAI